MQQRHGCDHCEDQPAFPRTILLIIAGIESYCNRPRASITSPSAVPVASVARNPGSSCSSAWDTRTARTFAPPPPYQRTLPTTTELSVAHLGHDPGRVDALLEAFDTRTTRKTRRMDHKMPAPRNYRLAH